jgi:hypothetical protein
MRTAAISLVFVAVVLSVWQFIVPGSPEGGMMIPPAPTPSTRTAHFTSTTTLCEITLYTVQEGDTVASIAARFMIAEEELRAANNLQLGSPSVSTRLVIPICNFTPTGTVHPATFTSTNTPSSQQITYTPGG